MKSRHGTKVDGELIAEKAMLKDGSLIQAGHSEFRVGMKSTTGKASSDPFESLGMAQGARGRGSALSGGVEFVLPVAPDEAEVAAAEQAAKIEKFPAKKTMHGTGWVQYTVKHADLAPWAAVERLERLGNYYLMINPMLFEEPPAPSAECPGYLMNWLPPEAQATGSPAVLRWGAEGLDLPALWEQGWGKDACVGFVSSAPGEKLLAALRSALRGDKAGNSTKPPTRGMIGLQVPSVVNAVLADAPDRVIVPITKVLKMALVENDPPETWSLWCASRAMEAVEAFVELPPPPPVTEVELPLIGGAPK